MLLTNLIHLLEHLYTTSSSSYIEVKNINFNDTSTWSWKRRFKSTFPCFKSIF